MKSCKIILASMAITLSLSTAVCAKSDWDETPAPNKEESALDQSSATPAIKPLQGTVEESSVMPTRTTRNRALDGGVTEIVPTVPSKPSYKSNQAQSDNQTSPLSGKAIDDELRGMVQDGSLKSLPGLTDINPKPLHGQASLQDKQLGLLDPDKDDQELMVEWDRWRNRFLRAIQLGVQELVNNPDPDDYERPRLDPYTGKMMSRYPLGTGAAFSCQVTATGVIKNLEIVEPSGFPKYDKAVYRAVKQLEGTRILAFPKGSHRNTVSQAGRIKTATNSDFNYYHFGDVERIRSGGQ